jgi:hypothetical protein
MPQDGFVVFPFMSGCFSGPLDNTTQVLHHDVGRVPVVVRRVAMGPARRRIARFVAVLPCATSANCAAFPVNGAPGRSVQLTLRFLSSSNCSNRPHLLAPIESRRFGKPMMQNQRELDQRLEIKQSAFWASRKHACSPEILTKA